MKTSKLISTFLSVFTTILTIVSCNKSFIGDKSTGTLHFKFSDEDIPILRSNSEILDTNNFIFSVRDAQGHFVYNGSYGNAPEYLTLQAGTYNIKVISREFDVPEFAAPQYGDEQSVVINPGEEESIILHCIQTNAGVRLLIDKSFLTSYPSGALLLRSEDGALMYSYKEKRTAYFWPGEVQLILTENGVDSKLMTRILRANDILTLSVKASAVSEKKKTFSLDVDTTRNRLYEDFLIVNHGSGSNDDFPGGSEGGGFDGEDAFENPTNAMTIAEAMRKPNAKKVWVKGFIAGGDLSSSKASYNPPFKSKTNILLAPRAGKCSRESCLSISLPTGKVRDALNLVDHPNLLGKSVYLKGDIVEKYFGLIGLKNTTAYKL